MGAGRPVASSNGRREETHHCLRPYPPCIERATCPLLPVTMDEKGRLEAAHLTFTIHARTWGAISAEPSDALPMFYLCSRLPRIRRLALH